jgi:hypothetical protein
MIDAMVSSLSEETKNSRKKLVIQRQELMKQASIEQNNTMENILTFQHVTLGAVDGGRGPGRPRRTVGRSGMVFSLAGHSPCYSTPLFVFSVCCWTSYCTCRGSRSTCCNSPSCSVFSSTSNVRPSSWNHSSNCSSSSCSSFHCQRNIESFDRTNSCPSSARCSCHVRRCKCVCKCTLLTSRS